ncbi:MAG: MCP four helix bundle domain-containing protein [Spirochaetes bacterium]|nr:MCP four helix bundle domain-containing protein [Spirochaetota bacterium]
MNFHIFKSILSAVTGMKIVSKIIVSFSIILLLSIAAIGFLLYELQNVGKKNSDKMYNTFIIANLSLEAEKALREFDTNLTNLSSAISQKNQSEAMSLSTELPITYQSISSSVSGLKKWIEDEKGKETLQDIESMLKIWEDSEKDFVRLVMISDNEKVNEIVNQLKKGMSDRITGVYVINKEAKAVADNAYVTSKEVMKRVTIVSMAVAVFLIVIVALIAIYLSRNIYNSISSFKNIFTKGASGDLGTRYPVRQNARDEINEMGSFFNSFIDKVRNTIKEVVFVSDDLGVSSDELSSTLTSFAENSQSQAASSEEITATMEEISAGVDNVSENSQFQYKKLDELITLMNGLSDMINTMAARITETQDLSKKISEQAESGNESLRMMDTIMNKITESFKKVTDIVDIINNISTRINLLSLNAAIEAARAGEAGRGFAVVADEISKLADQTASSIGDIDLLIKQNKEEVDSGMHNVVNTVNSIGSVIDGVDAINEMMNMLIVEMRNQQTANESVNESAEDVRKRSDEVRSASEEQKTAVNEAMKSMTNINDLIQSTAAGAEQMTANASKLASMAENLRDKISFFKI